MTKFADLNSKTFRAHVNNMTENIIVYCPVYYIIYYWWVKCTWKAIKLLKEYFVFWEHFKRKFEIYIRPNEITFSLSPCIILAYLKNPQKNTGRAFWCNSLNLMAKKAIQRFYLSGQKLWFITMTSSISKWMKVPKNLSQGPISIRVINSQF